MNLWIDDIRLPPDGWDWAKTSAEAIEFIRNNNYEVASFDHDLGGTDTTRKVILWLCENEEHWPNECRIHTANPVGWEWLFGMINRYKPYWEK